MPCVPDAWAQGSVPQKNRPLMSPLLSEPGTDITDVTGMSHHAILEDVVCESHADIELEDGEEEGGEEDKEVDGEEEEKEEGGAQTEDVSERLANAEQEEAEPKSEEVVKEETKVGTLALFNFTISLTVTTIINTKRNFRLKIY